MTHAVPQTKFLVVTPDLQDSRHALMEARYSWLLPLHPECNWRSE